MKQMKNKQSLIFAMLFIALSSCSSSPSEGTSISEEDYIKNVVEDDIAFNILQLTDIHWNMTTRFEEATKYLKSVINTAKKKAEDRGEKLNLIAITGDSLLVATKPMADLLYSTIDSFDIPFFVTYGNHDRQGLWNEEWMNENVSSPKRKNSLFTVVKDDVHGVSNYVINWKKNNKTVWQIYSVDTGHYIKKNAFQYTYDYIRDSQIEWFKKQTDFAKESSTYLPSLVFSHIPVREMINAANDEATILEREEKEKTTSPVGSGSTNYVGGYIQEKNDLIGASPVSSNFFSVAEERNVKGMFYGHDHSSDAVFTYGDKKVVIGYGVKSNTELYYTSIDSEIKTTLSGGALYTLHSDTKTFDIEHFYMDYPKEEISFSWKKEAL